MPLLYWWMVNGFLKRKKEEKEEKEEEKKRVEATFNRAVSRQPVLPAGPERIRTGLWMTVADGVTNEPSRLRHFLPLLRDDSPCHRRVRDAVAADVLRLVKRVPAACVELFHRDVRDIIMQPNTAGRGDGTSHDDIFL